MSIDAQRVNREIVAFGDVHVVQIIVLGVLRTRSAGFVRASPPDAMAVPAAVGVSEPSTTEVI